MSDTKIMKPVSSKQILFYDDELTAVIVETETGHTTYVPVRPIVEYLGLNWAGQQQRIQRDPILSEVALIVRIESENKSETGGNPNVLCLPLDFLNGFLFSIQVNRIKPELQAKVLIYQRECYRVLASAFIEEQSLPVSTVDSTTVVALQQIRETALAVARMAEEHIQIIARQNELATQINKAAILVGEHGRRISQLEGQLGPRQAITDEQATDIAEKVKALAMSLTEKDSSKNQFQSIFAELYRRFRVSSYKVIRQSQYHLVMDFLDEWAETVVRAKKLS